MIRDSYIYIYIHGRGRRELWRDTTPIRVRARTSEFNVAPSMPSFCPEQTMISATTPSTRSPFTISSFIGSIVRKRSTLSAIKQGLRESRTGGRPRTLSVREQVQSSRSAYRKEHDKTSRSRLRPQLGRRPDFQDSDRSPYHKDNNRTDAGRLEPKSGRELYAQDEAKAPGGQEPTRHRSTRERDRDVEEFESTSSSSDLGFRPPRHESRSPRKGPSTQTLDAHDYPRRKARVSGPTQSSRQLEEADSGNDPVSIPYTTAASEFLYGANVVIAVLKSRKRKIYKVYLHSRAFNDEDGNGAEIARLAKECNATIKQVGNTFLREMDHMAGGRPHNGVIVEASPLPFPPIDSMGAFDPSFLSIPLVLSSKAQSAEERAINGAPTSLKVPQRPSRNPLIVFLDGITDPGNLGNILRTCYFYGVTAVGISVNTCAPINSPVLIKAAAGATEALNVLAVQRPSNFISQATRDGWNVYASAGPAPRKAQLSTATLLSPLALKVGRPSILMLGGEGEGLRTALRRAATFEVTIEGARREKGDEVVDVGVDSINVSSAAAVLLEAFTRPPPEPRILYRYKGGGQNQKRPAEGTDELPGEEDARPSRQP